MSINNINNILYSYLKPNNTKTAAKTPSFQRRFRIPHDINLSSNNIDKLANIHPYKLYDIFLNPSKRFKRNIMTILANEPQSKQTEDKILAELKKVHPYLFKEQNHCVVGEVKLTREQLLNIVPFVYIENRKKQFTSEELLMLATLNKSQLEKIKLYISNLRGQDLFLISNIDNDKMDKFDYCINIPDRKKPFEVIDILTLLNELNDEQFENVKPYHLQVPSFGEWGFNLAYNGKASIKE